MEEYCEACEGCGGEVGEGQNCSPREWSEEDSNLMKHTKRELQLLGYKVENLENEPDDPNTWMVEDILELMRVFAKQGHSGFSAPYCIKVFSKLANFEPIKPLTGEDDEWDNGRGLGGTLQNKRCSHVFKDKNGAYDIHGKIFVEPDGSAYTSFESRVPITFPYVPRSEYVKVDKK